MATIRRPPHRADMTSPLHAFLGKQPFTFSDAPLPLKGYGATGLGILDSCSPGGEKRAMALFVDTMTVKARMQEQGILKGMTCQFLKAGVLNDFKATADTFRMKGRGDKSALEALCLEIARVREEWFRGAYVGNFWRRSMDYLEKAFGDRPTRDMDFGGRFAQLAAEVRDEGFEFRLEKLRSVREVAAKHTRAFTTCELPIFLGGGDVMFPSGKKRPCIPVDSPLGCEGMQLDSKHCRSKSTPELPLVLNVPDADWAPEAKRFRSGTEVSSPFRRGFDTPVLSDFDDFHLEFDKAEEISSNAFENESLPFELQDFDVSPVKTGVSTNTLHPHKQRQYEKNSTIDPLSSDEDEEEESPDDTSERKDDSGEERSTSSEGIRRPAERVSATRSGKRFQGKRTGKELYLRPDSNKLPGYGASTKSWSIGHALYMASLRMGLFADDGPYDEGRFAEVCQAVTAWVIKHDELVQVKIFRMAKNRNQLATKELLEQKLMENAKSKVKFFWGAHDSCDPRFAEDEDFAQEELSGLHEKYEELLAKHRLA